MPRPIAPSTTLAPVLVLILVSTSLAGGRSLVAHVDSATEHVVKEGETLGGIRRSHGVPLDQLVALNDLADPNVLVAGQALELPSPAQVGAVAAEGAAVGQPAPASAAARPADTEYVVRPGDTLSGVARAFGTTFRALAEANRLADPDRLKVGQRLLVPAGGRSGQPTAPAARPASPPASLAERVVAAARAVAGPRARIGVAGHDLVGGQRVFIPAEQAFPGSRVNKLSKPNEAYAQKESGPPSLTDSGKRDPYWMKVGM